MHMTILSQISWLVYVGLIFDLNVQTQIQTGGKPGSLTENPGSKPVKVKFLTACLHVYVNPTMITKFPVIKDLYLRKMLGC